jgi:[lysine-biosynthesis-protein LysW]---L-2-aminoadipate ligase
VTGDAPAIAVLASQIRQDERRLLDALHHRRVSYEHVDTRTLWAGASGHGRRWRCVLNREIGQVRAAYAARMLESGGMLVVNDAAATEVCGDKWRTSLGLSAAGVPTPRTALGLTPEAGLAALDEIGYPALIKPLVGSWGRLIVELRDRRMAEDVFEYVAALPGPQSHLVYVQELIAKPGRDIRAIVVGGKLLGATYRIAAGLRTNVARGAQSERCQESAEITKLALAAAAAVGAEVAAVDLVEDAAGGIFVLEVNHRVEFSGFQAAMGERVDVADRIVEHLMTRASGEPG